MSAPVLVYGAGHLGRQVLHHLRCHAPVRVLGFLDDVRPAGSEVADGLRVLGALHGGEVGPADAQLVFAIGYADMAARRRALQRALDAGWRLYTLLHPRAMVEPGAALGDGCIVMANAVVDQQVSVGAACFLDIGVRLTAGTRVGCNNYFSSGTSTGSRVTIGDDCFFGMDCTVTTEVRLGSRLFVNAKTLLARDLGDDLKVVELHQSRALPLPRGAA